MCYIVEDSLTFTDLKEVQYFRNLLDVLPIDFLHNILPRFVKKCYEEEFNLD